MSAARQGEDVMPRRAAGISLGVLSHVLRVQHRAQPVDERVPPLMIDHRIAVALQYQHQREATQERDLLQGRAPGSAEAIP